MKVPAEISPTVALELVSGQTVAFSSGFLSLRSNFGTGWWLLVPFRSRLVHEGVRIRKDKNTPKPVAYHGRHMCEIPRRSQRQPDVPRRYAHQPRTPNEPEVLTDTHSRPPTHHHLQQGSEVPIPGRTPAHSLLTVRTEVSRHESSRKRRKIYLVRVTPLSFLTGLPP